MGSIHFKVESMFGSLSDLVGSKSGLALNERDLRTLLSREEDGRFTEYLAMPEDDWVRIESIVYEDMVECLLYSVGRLERRNNPLPGGDLYRKYRNDAKALEMLNAISGEFVRFMDRSLDDSNLRRGQKIDMSPFVRMCFETYGRHGVEMADNLVSSFAVMREIKSVHFPAVSEWEDEAELEDLFRAEGLETQYGSFFDQRYIDYLHRNFEDIDRVNWRKFEGLTGEYFDRQGFRVEMGPGRNDDGVDVRVWPSEESPESSPAIIIQCKRQRLAVSKVIVKSLYADILDSGASSGLIVTTSKLAPSAREVCTVRSYPIGEADREMVRQWVQKMRRPGLGTAA